MLLIISNIAGIIGWLLLILSYHKKDVNNILLIQIISSIFYCINYLLLGAWTGLIICFFELIKEHLYYKTDLDDYIFIASLFIYFIIGYLSFNGLYTLLPVIGSIIDSYALTKNKTITVIGAILSNILWVIYDLIIGAYTVAITDAILVFSNISILIIGYSRLIKSKDTIISKCTYLSNSLLDYIQKIDTDIYKENYTWTKEYQKNIYNKNKNSILILKNKNRLLGYINYLCITEKEYNGLKKSKNYIKKYNENEIINFNKRKYNYIIIESIAISSKYQNNNIKKLIENKLYRLLKKLYKNGYKVKGIISIPIDAFEKEIITDLKFNKIKEYDSSEILYELPKESIDKIIDR